MLDVNKKVVMKYVKEIRVLLGIEFSSKGSKQFEVLYRRLVDTYFRRMQTEGKHIQTACLKSESLFSKITMLIGDSSSIGISCDGRVDDPVKVKAQITNIGMTIFSNENIKDFSFGKSTSVFVTAVFLISTKVIATHLI